MTDDSKELLIVVDKEDTILEYRSRYDCHHNKNLIHRAIAIIIFNNEGEILLQKRSMSKDLNPGLYANAVGGHVGKGQTYEEAAKRELLEELGIEIQISFKKKYLSMNNQEAHMVSLFEGKSDGPFSPNKDEVDKLEFIDIRKLRKLENKLTPHAKIGLKEISLL